MGKFLRDFFGEFKEAGKEHGIFCVLYMIFVFIIAFPFLLIYFLFKIIGEYSRRLFGYGGPLDL